MTAGRPAEQLQNYEMDQVQNDAIDRVQNSEMDRVQNDKLDKLPNNEKDQDQVEPSKTVSLAPATEPQNPPSDESLKRSSAPSDSVSDDFLLHLKFHPLTELFPQLEGKQYEDLKEDIRKHGQLVPILIHDRQIIDGRARFLACEELGIEPHLEEWNGKGSLVGLVISLNHRRRHLTASQRAMVAAQAKPLFEEEAKQRMLAGKASDPTPRAEEGTSGEAAGQAAKALGVGRNSVYQAQKVLNEGAPELKEAVEHDQVSVATAADLTKLPPEEQADTLAAGKHAIAKKTKDLRQQRAQAKKGAPGKRSSKPPVRAAQTILDGQEKSLAISLDADDQEIVESLVEGLGTKRAKAVCKALCTRLQIKV